MQQGEQEKAAGGRRRGGSRRKGGSREGGRWGDTTRAVTIAGWEAVATESGRSSRSRWRWEDEAAPTRSDGGNSGGNERRAGSGRG